jgi:hypothetical protein
LAALGLLLLASGCASLDKAYNKEVTWTNAPVIKVATNTVLATNIVAQVLERTNSCSSLI